MRATLVLTTADGIYEGTVELLRRPAAQSKVSNVDTESQGERNQAAELDFGLPVRPFMKKHAGRLSGPKKLALLVAHMSAGNASVLVEHAQVEATWNRMAALMGGRYNRAYSARARDNGWLHSPAPGVYQLLSGWKNLLQ